MDIAQFLYFPDADAQALAETGAGMMCTDLDKKKCRVGLQKSQLPTSQPQTGVIILYYTGDRR